MTSESKSIRIPLDAATEQKLKTAAARRGVSVERYCRDAIGKELDGDSSPQKISLAGRLESGKVIMQGNLKLRDCVDSLLALRDEVSRGATDSTDSAILIREARIRRGQRQDDLGRS